MSEVIGMIPTVLVLSKCLKHLHRKIPVKGITWSKCMRERLVKVTEIALSIGIL